MSLYSCAWLRGHSLVLCSNFPPAHILKRGPIQLKPLLREGAVHLRRASTLCRHGSNRTRIAMLGRSGMTAFAILGGVGATSIRAYCSEKTNALPGNEGTGQTSKTPKRGSFKKILAFAKPERGPIALGIGLLFVSSAVTMLVPYGIGKVIDMIVDVEDGMSKLKKVAGTIAAVFLIGAVANFGRVYLFQTASNNIIAELRKRVFRSIMTQEGAFFDKNQSGELLNRLSADTQLVGKTLTDNISDLLRSSAQALAGFAMMAYMSPKLTTAVLGVVPVIGAMAMVYGRFVKKMSTRVQDSLANATQVAGERISNVRTVRAFAQEDVEIERYNQRVNEIVQLGKTEALARGIFFGSTGMTGNFIMLSVLWFGGQMMHAGDITVGNLTSFLIYTAYVGMSIVGLSTAFSDIMKGIGASNRLFEIIEKTPAIPLHGGLKIPKEEFKGAIEFQNVDFSYEGRDVRVFDGLKLNIPPHTVLGVVGRSGSGKSSLGSLLFRLYDVNAGSILIDGRDIRDLDPHWLRSNVGVVSQEPVLFSGTLAENIAYGCPDARAEEIVEAAKKANAHQFIEEFPEGYSTVVGERGQSLSGGQRQRVAIARALLLNPTVLILDEATSALDSESERLVQDALEKHLLVGRTVITIAHRLSTIKHADSVAVLDDGKVVEQGTYKDLMNNAEGHFKRLVERQAYVLHE